jgi:tetratricopeptide (TPR) repeat protein
VADLSALLEDPLAHRALEALIRAETRVTRRLAHELERRGISATGFATLVVLHSAGGAIELRLLEQARVAWSAERWADAVQLFEQALRLAPATQEVEEALAEARRRLAESEARTRQRARLERQYIRATMLMDEQRWDEAEQALDQVLAIDPQFRDAEALRARVRDRRTELVRQTERATNEQHTIERAFEACKAGEWHAAVGMLERLAEANPEDEALSQQLDLARVMVQVADLNAEASRLVEQGRWEEAMVKMEEAKALDPHYRD